MRPFLLILAASALCVAAAAQAQTVGAERVAALDVAQLKTAYLACDEEATRNVLDAGSAAICSQIAEALKARAFGGDFERLLAWWREAKAARTQLARSRE